MYIAKFTLNIMLTVSVTVHVMQLHDIVIKHDTYTKIMGHTYTRIKFCNICM